MAGYFGAGQPNGDVMKCGVRVALGVAGGYFLGRTKKMKLGLMLAGMAAGRQAGGPAALLGQGKNLLNASPELSRLSDVLTGRLLDAGKGAALAVATHQVESLTDRLLGRVEQSLGNVGGGERPPKDTPEAAGDGVGEVESDVESPDLDAPDLDADTVDADKEPVAVGARSDPDQDAQSDAAANRSAGRAGGTARASRGAGRTAVRRTASAASGGRRTDDKAVGRASRAKRRDDNG
jgi:hypothetical protein